MTTSEGAQLFDIACPKPSTCVVAGENPETEPNGQPAPEVSSTPLIEHPLVFSTTDGGAHWASGTRPIVGGVDGAACASIKVCLVVGYAARIVRTTDGGTTWAVVRTPRRFNAIDSVACPTRSFCIVGGSEPTSSPEGSSVALVSQDAGATWSRAVVVAGPVNQPKGSSYPTALGALSCSGAQHCIGLIVTDLVSGFGTGSPTVTSDAGRTWTRGPKRIGSADSCIGSFCVSVGGHLQPLAGDAFVVRGRGQRPRTTNAECAIPQSSGPPGRCQRSHPGSLSHRDRSCWSGSVQGARVGQEEGGAGQVGRLVGPFP